MYAFLELTKKSQSCISTTRTSLRIAPAIFGQNWFCSFLENNLLLVSMSRVITIYAVATVTFDELDKFLCKFHFCSRINDRSLFIRIKATATSVWAEEEEFQSYGKARLDFTGSPESLLLRHG